MRRIAIVFFAVAALAGCGSPDEPVITIPADADAGNILNDAERSGPADTIGDGTHEVLVDVQAGKYRTEGPLADGIGSCFWYRLSGTGGTLAEIIASGTIYGPTTVTIWPGDKAFKTEFCQPWTRIGDTP